MDGIAVYERDDLMHALLREWLSGAGYPVRDAAAAADSGAAPGLAIVSLPMPKAEGDALIGAVQRVYPGTPIIALSSQARSGLSSGGAAAHALGVTRVVAKPLSRRELLAAVEAVIGAPSAPAEFARDPARGAAAL